jgi:hypothetical protein
MTCPNCNTMSCYICRQVIRGYDHFGNVSLWLILFRCPSSCSWFLFHIRSHRLIRAVQTPKNVYCGIPLNRDTQTRWASSFHSCHRLCESGYSFELAIFSNLTQVTKAAQEALEEYKRQHPNMDQEELKAIEVDLPPPPPPPPQLPAHGAAIGPANPFGIPRMGMGMGMPVAGHGIAFAQAQQLRMQQVMAAAQPAPPLNPAYFNFNINFADALPAFPPPLPRVAAAVPAAAAPRKRRGRRRWSGKVCCLIPSPPIRHM